MQLLRRINGTVSADPETVAQQTGRLSIAERSRENARVSFILTGPPL